MPTIFENKKLVSTMLEGFRVYLGRVDNAAIPTSRDVKRFEFLQDEVVQLTSDKEAPASWVTIGCLPDKNPLALENYASMRDRIEKLAELVSK
jgi:hypothetical protein